MTHRAVMVGAGGWASVWIQSILPAFRDRVEIVALVDIEEDVLKAQQEFLKLTDDKVFRSMREAFDAVARGVLSADCVFVVTPPTTHREAIELGIGAGLNVLCEKPLAVSWQDCVAIHDAVATTTQRVAVMQNYRHTPAVRAARALLARGEVGDPYLISARFRADYREFGSWAGPSRHQMQRPVLEDAAIHHLDQIRYLSGRNFEQIICEEWRPASANGFAGTCCVSLIGRLQDGVRATYEASVICASEQRSWTQEEYRIECAEGAIVVRGNQLTIERHGVDGLVAEPVNLPAAEKVLHPAAIEEFLNWVDGGEPPDAIVVDNVNSVAAVIAALESADDGHWALVKSVKADNE